jgi:hypothetical protein
MTQLNELKTNDMNPISIHYDGMRPYLQEATERVNLLFREELFYSMIAAHPWYAMADVSPDEIAAFIRQAGLNMSIDLYYAMSPLKEIDGYDDVRDPNVIHMNIWKIERPVASICNTLVHACVHAVNALHDRHYFGHGEGHEGMEQTAPYKIVELAQMYIASDTQVLPMEHDIFVRHHKYIQDYLDLACCSPRASNQANGSC